MSAKTQTHPEPATFTTTHWSVVLAAQAAHTPQAAEALEKLCLTYWYPLYAFVRRQGRSPEDAQDLTQEFFSRLLQRDWLQGVQPQHGRFRSFLLAAMNHFLANEWRHRQAQKRGGNCAVLSLDAQTAEGRYLLEPAHEQSPERPYDRRWALTLLEVTMRRLREACAESGRGDLFAALKGMLAGDADQFRSGVAALDGGCNKKGGPTAARRVPGITPDGNCPDRVPARGSGRGNPRPLRRAAGRALTIGWKTPMPRRVPSRGPPSAVLRRTGVWVGFERACKEIESRTLRPANRCRTRRVSSGQHDVLILTSGFVPLVPCCGNSTPACLGVAASLGSGGWSMRPIYGCQRARNRRT